MLVTLVAVTATSDQNQGDHAFGKEKTKTPIAQVFLQIEPFLKWTLTWEWYALVFFFRYSLIAAISDFIFVSWLL